MAGDAIKTSSAATLVTGMPESLGRCVEVSGQDGVLVTKFVSAHNYAILPAQNQMFVIVKNHFKTSASEEDGRTNY